MYKALSVFVLMILAVAGYCLWQQQDLRKNVQVQRELSSIYKQLSMTMISTRYS
jgi:predicted negative regulator of RcsB-dependent stress response